MSKITKLNQSEKPMPFPGFLKFFIVTLFLGVLYNLFNGLGEIGDIGKYSILNATYPNLRELLIAEATMFIVSAFLGVCIIALFIKRQEIARSAAIIFFVVTAIWVIVDVLISMHIFTGTPENAAINSSMQFIFRTVFFDIVWSIYLIRSKKTKSVLTNKTKAFDSVKSYLSTRYKSEP